MAMLHRAPSVRPSSVRGDEIYPYLGRKSRGRRVSRIQNGDEFATHVIVKENHGKGIFQLKVGYFWGWDKSRLDQVQKA